MDKPLGDYTYSPSFLSIPSAPTCAERCVRLRNPKGPHSCWFWTGDRKELFVQQLRYADFTAHAQAFGWESNALPKLCNSLRSKRFGSTGRVWRVVGCD